MIANSSKIVGVVFLLLVSGLVPAFIHTPQNMPTSKAQRAGSTHWRYRLSKPWGASFARSKHFRCGHVITQLVAWVEGSAFCVCFGAV
eukprot:641861-Amphidinium_carterae.1